MYEPAGTIEGVVELVVGGGGWVVELVIRAGTGLTARVRSSIFYFLLLVESVVRELENEVGPDDVEDKEDGEEAVEDVVGREHLHQLRGLNRRTIENPSRENPETRHNPTERKDSKA